MSKPTDVAIVEAEISIESLPYRAPLKFGGRIVSQTDLINFTIKVRAFDGQEASGYGSMPLGNVWAWPTAVVSEPDTAEAIRRFATKLADVVRRWQQIGHPIDLVHEISKQYSAIAREVETELQLAEPMPKLAILVAASAFDAALHDAFGHVHRRNAYNCLSHEFMARDLSHYLNGDFQGEYLDQYTLRDPKPRMPLYHLVGALDPLTAGDISKRIDDGLPETLGEWIGAQGIRHFKIKLNGEDLGWDVARVVAVNAVVSDEQHRWGHRDWWYSLDFNEKCRDVEYVLDFLARVKESGGGAFDRVQYIEQPTHRNLKAHPEAQMHRAAAIKPVVIDESLVDFESLLLAREMGYSGVALKSCKGQTEALLMAAAAQKYGMFLCVQDLTCPGASFLQSAELAARIPTVAAIEGNGRQYCPAGNVGWTERFPSMFQISDGTLGTACLTGNGLGHTE